MRYLIKIFFLGFLVFSLIFSVRIYFKQSKFNKDDQSFKMSFKKINHNLINKDTSVYKILFVGNSRCPGSDYSIDKLKENIKYFKKLNLKYYIIFDEVNRKSENQNLKIKTEKMSGEQIFVIDNNIYESKQGLYNSWRRYLSFIKKFDNEVVQNDLSYPKYFIIKNKKIISISSQDSIVHEIEKIKISSI